MKRRLTMQGLALTLCVGLLLSLCGCKSSLEEQAGATASTASTVANDEETPTTTEAKNTTTTEETTTTTTTTTATGQTETTTKPVEETLQIGGKYFTLDGETFGMGVSPEKLLAHLGEPSNTLVGERADASGMFARYTYDHLLVETAWYDGIFEEILVAVYFTDDYYSFNGIAVGDTAEKLDDTISKRLKPDVTQNLIGAYSGKCYMYDADGQYTFRWYLFFPDDEEDALNEEDTLVISPDSKINVIEIYYNFARELL